MLFAPLQHRKRVPFVPFARKCPLRRGRRGQILPPYARVREASSSLAEKTLAPAGWRFALVLQPRLPRPRGPKAQKIGRERQARPLGLAAYRCAPLADRAGVRAIRGAGRVLTKAASLAGRVLAARSHPLRAGTGGRTPAQIAGGSPEGNSANLPRGSPCIASAACGCGPRFDPQRRLNKYLRSVDVCADD